jgi:hypothetical protein
MCLFFPLASALLCLRSFRDARLFTIPGALAPLERFCARGSDLLLLYQHGLARVWDAENGEFRRSVDRQTALNILRSDEDWFQVYALSVHFAIRGTYIPIDVTRRLQYPETGTSCTEALTFGSACGLSLPADEERVRRCWAQVMFISTSCFVV